MLDVDYRGVQCKKEKYYQKDLCTTKKIEKELIDKVGCTTPFGHDKSQICRQEDDASKASDIYYHEISLESNCSNPCSLFSLAISNEEKQSSTNATYLSIVLKCMIDHTLIVASPYLLKLEDMLDCSLESPSIK